MKGQEGEEREERDSSSSFRSNPQTSNVQTAFRNHKASPLSSTQLEQNRCFAFRASSRGGGGVSGRVLRPLEPAPLVVDFRYEH